MTGAAAIGERRQRTGRLDGWAAHSSFASLNVQHRVARDKVGQNLKSWNTLESQRVVELTTSEPWIR